MKIQPAEWEKIFANDTINKGLTSKIHKAFIQLNIKKKKKYNPKIGRSNSHFSKEDI